MSMIDFAKSELTLAGMFDPDSDYGGMLGEAVLKMIKHFVAQDHSGASAAMTLRLFSKLAKWEPLTPLTGAEDEWRQVSENLRQNRRCPRIFLASDGQAFDIEGKIFEDEAGMGYTSSKSHVPVVFPYTPVSVYIKGES